MCAKTAEEVRNEQVIQLAPFAGGRELEKHFKFICLFANDRYFYDVGAGRKYFGSEIGVTVDGGYRISRHAQGTLRSPASPIMFTSLSLFFCSDLAYS
jgi:hypothetical protein